MTRKQWFILIFIALAGAQMACTFSAATVPAATVPVETPSGGCPAETTDMKLLKNEENGYCLLYPADDTLLPPRYIVINPVNAPGDTLGEGWVDIQTEAANARSAAQAADAEIAVVGPGFNISRNEVSVDGTQAIVVDGLPGQDSSRRMFIVSNDQLYTFTFVPWGQSARLEDLYTGIVNSLHFVSPTEAP